MTIQQQNAKAYANKGDIEALKRNIIKAYYDFSRDPETANCVIDCIAIMFDLDNDNFIKNIISGMDISKVI